MRGAFGAVELQPQVIQPHDLWLALGMFLCGSLSVILLERKFRSRPSVESEPAAASTSMETR